MKICVISNLFPPIMRGGAERVAERVARGLADAGHEVFVISTKPWSGRESLKPTATDEQGIKVYRFYPANIYYYLDGHKHNTLWRAKWHFLDMFNFHSRRVVKNILKEEKPDIVMTHNLMGIGFLLPRMIRGLGIKYVHTLHDVQLVVPSGLILKGQEKNWEQRTWLRKVYEKFCRWLFNSPDVVVSPSKWLLDFYANKGFFKKSKKIVLPNPVERIYPAGIPMDNSILKLLYLGLIEEHKGIFLLVEVLKKCDFDFRLHIAGDGSKMEELKKMIGDDLRFVIHGKLVGEKLIKIFDLVDLMVVPSLCYENSPAVIYESLAAGVPVIAAKIGGVAELVKDKENGFTFEVGNNEDLLRVLKHAAANRDELQKMRPATVKSVEGFKIENYINCLLESIK
ncbi:MAG: glycosyltransferase family 4 protein [Patescibacteria group bacterium]